LVSIVFYRVFLNELFTALIPCAAIKSFFKLIDLHPTKTKNRFFLGIKKRSLKFILHPTTRNRFKKVY